MSEARGAETYSKAGNLLVWRSVWLQTSETFIRNQVDSLVRWNASCVGFERVESPLSNETDLALYGDSLTERLKQRAAKLLNYSPRLTRHLRTEQPDLVHAHFAFDGMLAVQSARKVGIPFVLTVHGVDVTMLPNRRGPRGAIYRHRLRRALSDSQAIVAVSEYIRRVVIDWGAEPERVRVLTTGVPITAWTSTGAPVGQHESDVLFVGRLVEKKGVTDLLDALGLLAARGIRPNVILIGDGPERDRVRTAISRLDANVSWLGSLPASETLDYISRAKIVVVPSRTAANGDSEGLPTVVLEAGAAGKPVVATRHSGIPEAVIDGETGLLAGEGDAPALAAALEKLIDDEDLRHRLGQAANSLVAERFDVKRQTELLEMIYDEVHLAAGRG